jgi:hypothetical protein
MESLARDAGYDALFVGVTSPFVRPAPTRNAYWINRLDMKSDVSLERFERIARGKMRDVLVLSGKEYALGAIKTVLGPRHYLNFRRLALRQIVK